MPKLIFSLSAGKSLDFPLNADVVRLGRREGNDIVIDNSWISSSHAEFRRVAGRLILKDLGSSNGTFVNGVRIAVQILNAGDSVGFGQLEATYDAELDSIPPVVTAVFPSPATRVRPVGAGGARPPGFSPNSPAASPSASPYQASGPSAAPGPASPALPPAASVMVGKPMAPPSATVAYDTARKEASAELELLQKKITMETAAAAKAEAERVAAQAALKEVMVRVGAARSEESRLAAARAMAEAEGRLLLENQAAALTSNQAAVAQAEAEAQRVRDEIRQERQAWEAERQEWAKKQEVLDGESLERIKRGEEARAARQAAEEAAAKAQAEVKTASEALAKLQEDHAEVVTAKSAVEFGLVSLTDSRKQLEGDLDRLRAEKLILESAKAAAASALSSVEEESGVARRKAGEESADWAARLSAAKAELERVESVRKTAESDVEKLNAQSAGWPAKEAVAQEQFEALESRILKARESAAAEDRKMSARMKALQQLEGQHNVLASKITRWQEQETAAETLGAVLAKDRVEAEALRNELAEGSALRDTLRTELAEATSKRTFLNQEIRTLESRLDMMRRESEGLETLHARVGALRKEQGESERRVEFLTDRLEGMSEAPDPNWGTVHSLARSFIRKLDLMDDLVAHLSGQSGNAEALNQVQVLRSGLLDILKEYSIESYSLEPGTVIDVAARKRIQIVETRSEESQDATRVVRTFRPGYVCSNGDLGISTLLRKADVAVAVPAGVAGVAGVAV
ncbi:MAG: domain containing protein [Verrucomicrobiales bacterium]|nr:domain containing protein [Verrucomicrobiales bacterium]